MDTNDQCTARLAAALLPGVCDSSVAAALIAEADFTENGPVPLNATIPGDTVLAQAKAPWVRSATAVRATDCPVALDKMARDSRLNVRRTAAANRHLAPATADYLLEWGISHSDAEVVAAVAGSVTLDVTLGVLDTHARTDMLTRNFKIGFFAERIIDTGDRGLILTALQSTYPTMRQMLGRARRREAVIGDADLVSLTDMFDSLTVDLHREQLLLGALSRGVVDVELATLLTRLDEARAELLSSKEVALTAVKFHFEPDAAVMLATSGKDVLVELASMSVGDLPDAAVEEIIDNGSLMARIHLITHHIEQMTGNRTDRIARSKEITTRPDVLKKLIATSPVALSPKELKRTLRHTGADTVVEWLAGGYLTKPRPGEAAESVANPTWWGIKPEDIGEAAATITRTATKSWGAILDKDWADEFVDALGLPWLTAALNYPTFNSYTSKYLTARLERVVGSDPVVWQSFVKFAPDWAGSVGELIETVMLVNGRDPDEVFAADIDVAEKSSEQLSLL